ncbi:CoA transferase [Arthrobacter sp. CDRTa11]|uniref:CoA transferase n=1 Tax=Arthrobacter sp. CDRTa11 TaxID=2651199 RepID=UPI003A5CE12E
MATADGRYVYMANVVPRLREGTLRVLGCAGSREAVEAAVLTWKASELEQAMAEAGLPLTVVRSSEEWLASPQGGFMTDSPIVHVEQLGSSRVEPVPQGNRSLAGLKVLDLTHVVAGPMITRGLAEHGADVLHVGPDAEDLQDPLAVTDELMIGKRSAGLNLKSSNGRREIERLIAGADVLVQSWRPGVMERWGLDANRVAQLRPGLVQLSVSCYGPQGPWSDRPGFDGNALAAVGATNIEAGSGVPRLTPPGVLTDSLAGFLGVALINSLLMDRAERGGSHLAHISLARMATWLMELGLKPGSSGEPASGWGLPELRRTTADDGGVLEHVAHPIQYQQRPARLSLPQPLLRASPPEWSDEASSSRSVSP